MPSHRPTYRRYSTAELVARRPTPKVREDARRPIIVVLDDVRSAYNVGLIFRLCDCANIAALWLGGITPYPGVSDHASNHIHKTGVGGSIHALPWRHVHDPVPAVTELRAQGWHVTVVEQVAGSVPWHRGAYRRPLVLVFGHERIGVRDALLALADEVVELPVFGVTNNLNVALCASAVLYGLLAHEAEAGDASAGAGAQCRGNRARTASDGVSVDTPSQRAWRASGNAAAT